MMQITRNPTFEVYRTMYVIAIPFRQVLKTVSVES
jgi:hypothetical protein